MARIRFNAQPGNICNRCGNIATHMTTSGIYWCCDETSKCPEIIKNIKKGQKNLKPNPSDPEKMRIKREKISNNMKARYASGWECSAGRCKKYEYISSVAGIIKVDGSWELIFCRYADKQKLRWRRNNKRFPYIRPDGKISTYLPDFYVEDWNSYIEIKGYETDLDRAKWEQFPEKLMILRKKEIGELAELV